MSFDAHKNFGYGAVLTPPAPAASGTTIVLRAGQGALMPAVPFNATVWPAGQLPLASNSEIVRVTARPGNADTFTILRQQEGSAARTIRGGDQFADTITAKTLTDIEGAITQEVSDRAAADTTEATTRAAADTAEASARAAADALLTPLTSPRLPPTPTASGRWLHDKTGGLAYESPGLSDLGQSGATDKQVVQWSTGSGAFVALLVTDANVASANKDGSAGTPSMRTLGTGATQAAAGNDARLSDARTPTAHEASHMPDGSDPLDWSGHIFQAGTSGAMPAASTAYANLWYYQTDKRRLMQCAADGSAWSQRTTGRVLYAVDDAEYGAVGNGSTDDTTPFINAHAAAVAAGGGEIVLGPKTYKLNTPNGNTGAINAAQNLAGRVHWHGAGRGLTTIKLGAAVSTFQTCNPDGTHPTIQNYAFSDFTLDGQGSSTTNKGYLVHYSASATGNPFDTGLHEVTRVDSVNFGSSTSQSRSFIRMVINRSDLGVTPTCYFRHLYVTDCYAGRSGGGGSLGINVSGFVSTASTAKDPSGRFWPGRLFTTSTTNPANVEIEHVYIRDFYHDTGQTPLASHGGTSSGTGAGIQLGGDGLVRHARIRGGVLSNSADVEIEIDNGFDVDIDGVVAKNCDGNAFLIMPFGGATGTQQSFVRVRNSRAVWEATGTDGAAVTDWSTTGGFVVNSRFGAISQGSVLFENCEASMEGGWAASMQLFLIGPAREVSVIGCKSKVTGNPVAGGGAKTLNHLKVLGSGRRMTLNVERFEVGEDYTCDATTVTSKWVNLGVAAALKVNWGGISGHHDVATANAGAHNLTLIEASFNVSSQTTTVAEDFASDQLDALNGTGGVCAFDAGTSSDYTFTTDHYVASANLSTEKRALYLATFAVTDSTNVIGRALDGAQYAKYTTGTTRSGYKAGIVGKRDPTSATNYLDAYLYDDGTNSYLCIDKVLAGVRTSLLAAVGATASGGNGNAGSMTITAITPVTGVSDRGIQLQTRLPTSTAHWPRLVVTGNTVYAEHFTSAPGNPVTRPATGAGGNTGAYVQVTLTGSDVNQYGALAVGYFGFSHIPVQSAAQLDDLTHQRLHVINGDIRGLQPHGIRAATNAKAFVYQPSAAGLIRCDDLTIRDSNLSTLGTATTPLEFDLLTDTGFVPRRRGITYYNAQPDQTVTLGASPAVWQNLTGRRVLLALSGQVTTKIELSKDGTTYRDIAGSGLLRVPPAWYTRVTYPGTAPTTIAMVED